MTRLHTSVATLYPPWVVEGLRAAAARHDSEEIDRLTDALATAGLVRQRHEAGRFESVAPFGQHHYTPPGTHGSAAAPEAA